MLPIHQSHKSVLVCDLTAIAPAEREPHVATIKQVLASVQEVRELPQGYALRLLPDSAVLLKATEFILRERLCCPFLNFALELEAGSGPCWLRLTGPEGVKEFLRMELGGLMGGELIQVAGTPSQM